MTSLVGPNDVERFRSLIAGRLGLDFDDGKLGHLAEGLRRRIDETGDSPAAYLRRLDSQGDARAELRALAPELTVSEKYFFRGADQLRAFEEVAVPRRADSRRRPQGAPGERRNQQTYGRFVTLKRLGQRRVAIGVHAVIGLRNLDSTQLAELPPILRDAAADLIEAIGTRDAQLLVVLRAARIIPDDVWATLAKAEATP